MKKMMKRCVMSMGLICVLLIWTGWSAAAGGMPPALKKLKPKDFPRKPIELMVAYPAGGGMDVTARVLAKYLPKYVGTKVIVVNKTGAAGLIGHAYLAEAAKNDGYTVGIVSNFLLLDGLLRSEGKWSYKGLTPLAYITFTPLNWIVKTGSKFGNYTIKQLVDYAKKNPEQIKVAVIPDSNMEFLVDKVEMSTGAKFNIVPFQGGEPGITALLGGHVDVAVGFLGEFKSLMEAGKVKPVASAGPERYVYLPHTPTFNEVLGVNDIVFGVYRYVAVPKGTPKDREAFLEAAFQAALRDPALIADYKKIGISITKHMSGAATSAELDQQDKTAKQVLTAIGKLK